MMPSVTDCRLVELPTISDERGSLTFLQDPANVPFPIRRLFYLHSLPGDVRRGGHAHRTCQQFLIAICGSLTVVMNDGRAERHQLLGEPTLGLYVPPGIWLDLHGFTPGAVCLVLASEQYDESDYVRTSTEFQQLVLSAGRAS